MALPLVAMSLRTRLILSFAVAIVLSLLLASGSFAYLLRGYQAEQEKDRLDVVAGGVSFSVVRAARAGASLADIGSQLDQQASTVGARILLIDGRGIVVHDTEQNHLLSIGIKLPAPAEPRQMIRGPISIPAGDDLYAVVGPAFSAAGWRIAVVAPSQSLTNAWLALLPRLLFAAFSALLVSIAIAWWLASSITRPIVRVTRASEEMARGNYDQSLPVPRQQDEVGRLAEAFNTMAREVARSHRAMRDLLANVSHDLRTPLTSIEGFSGALLDGTLSGPEGVHEAGGVIREEAERMRHLIEDLLYLGRLESGELALDRRRLDLAEIARAAQVRFTFRAEEADITLLLDAVQPVPVLGDQHRLAQVVDNLIENAFKHTPRGGRISLSVDREIPANATRSTVSSLATLRIQNSGSVIPPEDLDRVFERFYQVDKARASRNGRGLGLTIAQEIVQAHGGTIAVQSTAVEGTTFTLRLPVSLEATETPRLSSAGELRRGIAAETIQGTR